MTTGFQPETYAVSVEVLQERISQDLKWGEQNHPNGTSKVMAKMAEYYRDLCDEKHRQGVGTYLDILLEEVYEAAAEENPAQLRTELIQVAAVAVAWVEKLDRDEAKRPKQPISIPPTPIRPLR